MMTKFLSVITVFSLSFSAVAATSATLLLKGEVQEVLSISVAAEPMASTLPLDQSQTDTKVATVTEVSNLDSGYKVKISSENIGNLKRVGGQELFSYGLKYNGNSIDLANSQTFEFPSVKTTGTSKDITISYSGVDASSMVAGEYTDTVLFEISAN